MTDANEPAPKILGLPIGLDATGMRQEFDSLGTVEVPADRYWGAQTQRSLQHFNIGNDRMPKEVYHAYGYVKKAAAVINTRAGRLPAWKGGLIERVCDEVISGALDEEFPLYVFQTGSGTCRCWTAPCSHDRWGGPAAVSRASRPPAGCTGWR